MPISSGQVVVGTTPVQIDGTSVSNFKLHIHNDDNQNNLFIGNSNVTISNGLILQKLDSTELNLSPNDHIYLVSSSANHLVSYLKIT